MRYLERRKEIREKAAKLEEKFNAIVIDRSQRGMKPDEDQVRPIKYYFPWDDTGRWVVYGIYLAICVVISQMASGNMWYGVKFFVGWMVASYIICVILNYRARRRFREGVLNVSIRVVFYTQKLLDEIDVQLERLTQYREEMDRQYEEMIAEVRKAREEAEQAKLEEAKLILPRFQPLIEIVKTELGGEVGDLRIDYGAYLSEPRAVMWMFLPKIDLETGKTEYRRETIAASERGLRDLTLKLTVLRPMMKDFPALYSQTLLLEDSSEGKAQTTAVVQ